MDFCVSIDAVTVFDVPALFEFVTPFKICGLFDGDASFEASEFPVSIGLFDPNDSPEDDAPLDDGVSISEGVPFADGVSFAEGELVAEEGSLDCGIILEDAPCNNIADACKGSLFEAGVPFGTEFAPDDGISFEEGVPLLCSTWDARREDSVIGVGVNKVVGS